jgi:hypothetical protein
VFAYDRQVISGSDGRPPLPPGKPLKFLVEDPMTRNQSSTWRIWTSKNVDDLYICETKSGEAWKTSLHNDWGKWRIAMTKEAAGAQGIDRPVLSEQGRAVPVEGWSEGTSILIPCADLRTSSEVIPQDVIRIPTSPSSSAIGIRLLLQEPGIPTYSVVQGAFGLGVLQRPNGGAAYVFAEPLALNAGQHDALAAIRADATPSAPSDQPEIRFVGILAVDERRVLVDLALN